MTDSLIQLIITSIIILSIFLTYFLSIYLPVLYLRKKPTSKLTALLIVIPTYLTSYIIEILDLSLLRGDEQPYYLMLTNFVMVFILTMVLFRMSLFKSIAVATSYISVYLLLGVGLAELFTKLIVGLD